MITKVLPDLKALANYISYQKLSQFAVTKTDKGYEISHP